MSNIAIAGDTSGTITLQAPAIAGNTTLTLPATSGTLVTTASGQALTSPTITGTATLNGVNMTPYSMKNRIINGAMRIDQRNAGASVTPSTGTYTVDRWRAYQNVASKFTVQQVSGNANTTQGFDQSLRITSSSAYTPTGSNLFLITQNVEGNNIVDLAWGTSGAKTVTLSFWVYSSLTGTFGGALVNGAETLSYPFTYTISSANTWEQKTITVAGPTTGSWDTSTGVGIEVNFGIGAGSTYQGTAGSWQSGAYFTATGTTNIVATNGATWYLVGVQLEVGSVASAFEWRPYTTELQLCQRYFNTSYATGTATGTITTTNCIGRYVDGAGNWCGCTYSFPVQMRATPSVTIWGVLAGATTNQVSGDSSNKTGNVTFNGTCGFFGGTYNVASGSGEAVRFHYTASAE